MKRRWFIAIVAGAAVTSALPAHSQKPAVQTIGFLGAVSPGEWAPFVAAFRAGLNETGHVENRNVAIEFRWAEGQYARLPALAAELVNRRVAVLVTTGGIPAVMAAKAATSTIPIVFTMGSDPAALGIVASMARPGGNATGVSFFTVELTTKRLELLRELLPKSAVIGLIVNPASPSTKSQVSNANEAARSLGQQLHVFEARTEQEIDATFAAVMRLHPDAILVGTDPFFNLRRKQFVALASRYSVPAVYEGREAVADGGLMSYGPSLLESYRQVGLYTGNILNGAKPADMPVIQPTKFELVINLATAKSLGLAIPQSLLLRADEVIQ
jgi:putative tryptophan/tyrosine transport system substrate-binding protein